MPSRKANKRAKKAKNNEVGEDSPASGASAAIAAGKPEPELFSSILPFLPAPPRLPTTITTTVPESTIWASAPDGAQFGSGQFRVLAGRETLKPRTRVRPNKRAESLPTGHLNEIANKTPCEDTEGSLSKQALIMAANFQEGYGTSHQLKQELESTAKNFEQLEIRMATEIEEKEQLAKQLKEEETAHRATRDALTKRQSDVRGIERNLEDANARNLYLEQQAKDRSSDLKKAEKDQKAMKARLDTEIKAHQAMKDEMKTLLAQTEVAKTKLQNKEKRIIQLQDMEKIFLAGQQETEEKNLSLKAEIIELTKKLTEVQSALNSRLTAVEPGARLAAGKRSNATEPENSKPAHDDVDKKVEDDQEQPDNIPDGDNLADELEKLDFLSADLVSHDASTSGGAGGAASFGEHEEQIDEQDENENRLQDLNKAVLNTTRSPFIETANPFAPHAATEPNIEDSGAPTPAPEHEPQIIIQKENVYIEVPAVPVTHNAIECARRTHQDFFFLLTVWAIEIIQHLRFGLSAEGNTEMLATKPHSALHVPGGYADSMPSVSSTRSVSHRGAASLNSTAAILGNAPTPARGERFLSNGFEQEEHEEDLGNEMPDHYPIVEGEAPFSEEGPLFAGYAIQEKTRYQLALENWQSTTMSFIFCCCIYSAIYFILMAIEERNMWRAANQMARWTASNWSQTHGSDGLLGIYLSPRFSSGLQALQILFGLSVKPFFVPG